MKTKHLLLIALVAGFAACTDLEEEIRDTLPLEDFAELQDVDGLLQGAYQSLQLPFQDQSRFWASQVHTSDEGLGPTRGPDWDDNGVWRVLHDHTWSPDHAFLQSTFDEILQAAYSAINILRFTNADNDPDGSIAAQARFLRAFTYYSIADGWGQVPYRDPGENLLEPSRVFTAVEAIDYVIAELNEIIPDLPDGPANVANKNAARALLMRAHLNRGVFADRSNPTFASADLDEVISLAEEIDGTGLYELSQGLEYFDNFAPNNDDLSKENIWTVENVGGIPGGAGNNVRSRWFCTLHYNQNPSGWNGFTTLGDFYDSFEDEDIRKGAEYPGMTDVSGVRAGFLIGQQFDQDGNALEDRRGNPLAFTKEISLIETGNNLEITGIRVIKYPIDYNNGDNVDNDYVFLRYGDVLLMQAEAELRKGNSGAALDIVNDIRAARGASQLGSIDLDELLAERGRETYWEGNRRADLIRFGKFLDGWDNKPASGSERLLFPIPANALAVNPNLQQNPGY